MPVETRPQPVREAPAPGAIDFQAVFHAVARPLLLIAADPPKFTMVAVNEAHARAFGTTMTALVGRGVLEVFPPDPPPDIAAFVSEIRRSLEAVVATGRADQMGVRRFMLPSSGGEPIERFASAMNTPVKDAEGRVTHIVSAAQDVTGEVLERRSEEARRLLMREVDHRARNALTVVQSFVRLTLAPSLESFRAILNGRVEALARAQTSLAARRWEGGDLRDVMNGELAAISATGRYKLSGPSVILRPEHVQTMSMAIHELATNAAKYGALSTAAGSVEVAWALKGGERLSVRWQERGGPPVTPPNREGFGSRLVGELARQLRGSAHYHWEREGLCVELELKLGA